MNGKQILITTESHEMFVVRHSNGPVMRAYCPECDRNVEMLNFDAAVSRSGIGARELIQRSESGDVHSIESVTGHLMICIESLARGASEEGRSLKSIFE